LAESGRRRFLCADDDLVCADVVVLCAVLCVVLLWVAVE
jgi:hypothetical protein